MRKYFLIICSYNNISICSCDFNKYTIRVIKKLSETKIKDTVEQNGDDEEMMLIKNDVSSDSENTVSDDETSEE